MTWGRLISLADTETRNKNCPPKSPDFQDDSFPPLLIVFQKPEGQGSTMAPIKNTFDLLNMVLAKLIKAGKCINAKKIIFTKKIA